MKISIITVAYNSAATISDTLRSVATQTHPDVEHIVVDGASTDATMAVVQQSGNHISKLVSERDAGIYDAMNKGLALAGGDFVGFLNADDYLASDEVISEIASAASRPDVGAVCGDLVYVRSRRPDEVLRYWRCGEFNSSNLRFGWMPPHPTLYVRRSLVAKLGGFDISLRIAADYDFMLRYLSQPNMRVAYVPRVLVKMRTGGASNRSLTALARKSREDLVVLRRNGIGGIMTLLCKNARKLPQFFTLRP